jgi:heat shock protein HslJ
VCISLTLCQPALATDPAVESAQEARPPALFEGQDWRLTTYRSGSGLTEVAAQSRPTRFRFEGGQMSGSTGCNHIRGTYQVEGSALNLADGLASTRMGCPGPLMEQERAILEAIRSVATYQHQGERLDLNDSQGEPLLRFTRLTPTGPEGRLWRLEVHDNGQAGLVPPIAGSRIDLTLEPRGRVGGSDGCNRYLSGFTRAGDALSIGPIATTRLTCPSGEARAEQARTYAAALERVAAYRLDGDTLTLLDADDKTVARFRAEPGLEPPRPPAGN